MYTTVPISVLSFFGSLVVTLLIPSYLRAKNLPVLLSIFWLCLTGLCIGINTAGWQESVEIKWKPYCEFAIRIIYASTFALQCCSLLLLRRLEAIAATRFVSLTATALRKRLYSEIFVGAILPAIYIALAIINQGHRFDIIEDFGPNMSIYPSALSIIFSVLPPLLTSLIAITYAILCGRWLVLRRRQLAAVLSSSGTGVSKSQFVRLFGLTCLELFWTVPINWTIQMQNVFNRSASGTILQPYVSWNFVHEGFSFIGQYTIEELEMSDIGRKNLSIQYLGQLSIPISCMLFFIFLGTSSEVSRDLRGKVASLYHIFCRIPVTKSNGPKREQASSDRTETDYEHSFQNEVPMKLFDEQSGGEIRIEVMVEKVELKHNFL
uniref:Pheromone receptor a3 n=1 Tax=Ustanciosporium gigantosporum TaxID=1134041 RepID=H2CZ64_9BASI|nr:pheromone receptor a3 [Ustanciosporium gigantosporum]